MKKSIRQIDIKQKRQNHNLDSNLEKINFVLYFFLNNYFLVFQFHFYQFV
ncbi:hypothetical protein [Aliarcobacter butzleri]